MIIRDGEAIREPCELAGGSKDRETVKRSRDRPDPCANRKEQQFSE